ncbi:hypothetical protein CJ739_1481 [Mariniflexile rhizosphaerae]|uniref:DUF6427 family protein n=1 Tax=unclassified Mariniflexile TaxID=2643887 RepID=UPI000CA94816|nr:DUF6427 family protein [Mariniflexile sp. TRM1-10]AXP80570.1 hypothetical protein CJ739_1481 [Mariniflexile sp. TRM1-10]PLB20114.1 MAG: putative membrane protein [Flavobacteriaceae bacterium FS1-H7996/R]
MITSIFNKSKPINFIIVLFITVLAFITARENLVIETVTTAFVVKQMAVFFICIATILIFNFIISKNNLTKTNTYEILLFSLFLLAMVQTTSHTNILLSNLFVLLGLRRIISLRSQKSIKSKLFDAALWVAVASLFYFWAILFVIVIILSLIFYSDNNIRHWIIPFIGVATVFSIMVGVSVVVYYDFFEIFKSSRSVSYDFSPYNSTKYLMAITMLFSFGIWSSIFYLQSIKRKKKELRASFKIVIIAAIMAFVLILLAPQKNGSEFLFLFAPLAIIITNYIEIIEDKWFKEVFLAVLVLIPFLLLML